MSSGRLEMAVKSTKETVFHSWNRIDLGTPPPPQKRKERKKETSKRGKDEKEDTVGEIWKEKSK